MYRLVPHFIQDKFLANETSGLFNAVALFVDISGFTNITDALMGHGQHGAEVLANIIRDVLDPLTDTVFEQGGFVTNLAGDAFTAVFHLSGERPEVYHRALAAAWTMQRSMSDSSGHETPYGRFKLSAKVGLAAGEVSWGIISSTDEKRAAYYFQGPAIDGCAQAEQLAAAGEVIVDAAVADALGPRVTRTSRENHFQITGVVSALPQPRPVHLPGPDPDVVGRFFPPECTDRDLSGEFRQVVSMFVSLPALQTTEQLRSFMRLVFVLQDRYGGLLNRLDFGDKGASLLLLWGAPIAYENDVTRALSFILSLQSQTAIPVNAGITYGIALGGYSGGDLAGEYTCHGRGISLASRFMQTAPRGEIWVDQHVAERAGRLFDIEFEADNAFRGFTEKQKVFVLLDRKEVVETLFAGDMVGRETEKELLAEFLQPIWQGDYAGAIVIWGEAGIGKSRLVYSLLDHLKNAGGDSLLVILCQTDEILRESFNPFRYWLHRYFQQSEQQSDARNKRSFNRKLDQLVAATTDHTLREELDRTRSFLGSMVNLEWPDSLYDQLDARGRYENSMSGLLALLEAESSQRPLIVFLEDVHWLDSDSKAFLDRLDRYMTQVHGYPLAIVATSRSDPYQDVLGVEGSVRELHLSQLTVDDVAALASRQLGSPLHADLLDLLVERADGNPFFVEQILHYLGEQGQLKYKEEEWGLKANQDVALPDDVRTVLVARIDRLAAEVKEVVQTASVLGRQFEIRLLSRMLHNDPLVKEKVMRAEELSIWTAMSELHYLIKHALLRDAAYHMQVRSRRQALHREAAEALEELFKEDLSPHYGELAYHTEQANQIEKACQYLTLAAETSGEAYHNAPAIGYYTRALDLTPDEQLESRYQLHRGRENLHSRQGMRQEQLRDLDEMAALADRLDDDEKRVETLIAKSWFFYWTSQFDELLEAARQATLLSEAIGKSSIAAEAHYASAWAHAQWGETAAARKAAETALVHALKSGDLSQKARMLGGLGIIYNAEGDYSAARDSATQALLADRELHLNRLGDGSSLMNLGVIQMSLGDYRAARLSFEEALALGHQIGSRQTVGQTLVNLSWNAEAQGDYELAASYGEQAIPLLREVKGVEAEAEVATWLGHARLGLNQPELALDAYENALRLRRELGQEHLVMAVLAGMARVALAQDEPATAKAYVAEILAYLDGGGSLDGTWEPLRIYLACYRVLQEAQDSRAAEILQAAYGKLRELANKISDVEDVSVFLEKVPWHREIVAAHGELDASK